MRFRPCDTEHVGFIRETFNVTLQKTPGFNPRRTVNISVFLQGDGRPEGNITVAPSDRWYKWKVQAHTPGEFPVGACVSSWASDTVGSPVVSSVDATSMRCTIYRNATMLIHHMANGCHGGICVAQPFAVVKAEGAIEVPRSVQGPRVLQIPLLLDA